MTWEVVTRVIAGVVGFCEVFRGVVGPDIAKIGLEVTALSLLQLDGVLVCSIVLCARRYSLLKSREFIITLISLTL